MKVVKITLLLIVFICFSSVMGQVTVLFDKTFDDEATGADPADFILVEDGTADVKIAEFPSFLDKSLLTQGHDDGDVRATLPLNIDHGILVIEWDWYFTRHNIQFQIEGDLINEGGNDDVCHIYSFRTDLVDADSNMACVGSDAAQTRVPLGYFGGIETWVKMKVVFSLDDPWVHIFVNDTLRYADLPKASRILANTTGILWKHGDKESYINNLKVTHIEYDDGTVLADKNFDAEATGADPADFVLIEDGTANVSIVEFPSFLDKSLLTQGHDDGDVRATLPLNVDNGILVIEWDWYFTIHNVQFQIEGVLTDGGEDDVCHIYSFRTDVVDADSNMVVRAGDPEQTKVPIGYFGGIDTWVKMKVVFGLDDPWVHYYVNDTLRYGDLPKAGRILANTTGILWKHGDKESYINNLKLTHFQQGDGTAVEDITLRIPDSYQLQQNFPNPFNPSTTISYQLKQTADVRLEIYDLLGQKVRTLVKGSKTAGVYSVTWDANNDAGMKVVNGVYIYRLGINSNGEDFTESRKMVLLK